MLYKCFCSHNMYYQEPISLKLKILPMLISQEKCINDRFLNVK